MALDLSELLGTWTPDEDRLPEELAYARGSWLELQPDRVGFKGFDPVDRDARWYRWEPAALSWRLRRLSLIDCDFFGDELYVTLIRGLGGAFTLKVRGEDAIPWGDNFPVVRLTAARDQAGSSSAGGGSSSLRVSQE